MELLKLASDTRQAVVVIIFIGTKVWQLQRSDNKKWAFPGGGVEPNEEPRLAAAREVREELDMEINNVLFLAEREAEDKSGRRVFFYTAYGPDEAELNKESEAVGLFELDELPIDQAYPESTEFVVNKLKSYFKLAADISYSAQEYRRIGYARPYQLKPRQYILWSAPGFEDQESEPFLIRSVKIIDQHHVDVVLVHPETKETFNATLFEDATLLRRIRGLPPEPELKLKQFKRTQPKPLVAHEATQASVGDIIIPQNGPVDEFEVVDRSYDSKLKALLLLLKGSRAFAFTNWMPEKRQQLIKYFPDWVETVKANQQYELYKCVPGRFIYTLHPDYELVACFPQDLNYGDWFLRVTSFLVKYICPGFRDSVVIENDPNNFIASLQAPNPSALEKIQKNRPDLYEEYKNNPYLGFCGLHAGYAIRPKALKTASIFKLAKEEPKESREVDLVFTDKYGNNFTGKIYVTKNVKNHTTVARADLFQNSDKSLQIISDPNHPNYLDSWINSAVIGCLRKGWRVVTDTGSISRHNQTLYFKFSNDKTVRADQLRVGDQVYWRRWNATVPVIETRKMFEDDYEITVRRRESDRVDRCIVEGSAEFDVIQDDQANYFRCSQLNIPNFLTPYEPFITKKAMPLASGDFVPKSVTKLQQGDIVIWPDTGEFATIIHIDSRALDKNEQPEIIDSNDFGWQQFTVSARRLQKYTDQVQKTFIVARTFKSKRFKFPEAPEEYDPKIFVYDHAQATGENYFKQSSLLDWIQKNLKYVSIRTVKAGDKIYVIAPDGEAREFLSVVKVTFRPDGDVWIYHDLKQLAVPYGGMDKVFILNQSARYFKLSSDEIFKRTFSSAIEIGDVCLLDSGSLGEVVSISNNEPYIGLEFKILYAETDEIKSEGYSVNESLYVVPKEYLSKLVPIRTLRPGDTFRFRFTNDNKVCRVDEIFPEQNFFTFIQTDDPDGSVYHSDFGYNEVIELVERSRDNIESYFKLSAEYV